MTPDPLSFFTIDHGTASTAAALIAPVGGRFRLLAAAAAPRDIGIEPILADLVGRVRATEPAVLPAADDWPSWARLEVATHRPLRVVCAAGSERRADELIHTFGMAGWEVAARFASPRVDVLALTEACLDRSVTVVALGGGEPPSPPERAALDLVAAAVTAAAQRRPDLRLILLGGASGWSDLFPADRSVHGPVTGPGGRGGASGGATGAARFVLELATHWASSGTVPRLPDGRQAFAVGAASLATLLDRTVDAVDVGHSAGFRTVAAPDGSAEWSLRADAALVPRRAMNDDEEVDRILRWCALRAEHFDLRDRVRNLGLAPWRDAAGDGARIRLAALRASLERLSGALSGHHPEALLQRPTTTRRGIASAMARSRWGAQSGRAPSEDSTAGPDLVLASGGAFAAVPAPIAALALLDALRRPGARTLLWDHARLLAPMGTLSEEADRRRLMADLVDDAFVPLASTVIAGELSPGRPATLRVTSPVATYETPLAAGSLRTVDLPPGVTARVEIEADEPLMLGVRARHVAMDLTGGLAGLLVDGRETPLRLHERPDRRRAQLDGWERGLWAGLEP
ncbi:MAG: hypothetical protein M3452_01110 [Chloroflexota bacterium]|nr:hypothetical protein [Chloroflexota bacterium]